MSLLLAGIGGTDRALAAVWQTTYTKSMGSGSDSSGWGGSNVRVVIPSSALSFNGTSVRVTLTPTVGGGSTCNISSMYIGHAAAAGDPYDFDGNQVQLKVSTSGSFTLNAGAGDVLTDVATFSFDKTKNIVVAAHFTGTSNIRTTTVTGSNYYWNTAADASSTTDVSSYVTSSNVSAIVTKIEVQ